MATEPIKLRCGSCQQLLGASPSKAGTRVSCPKCGARVLVPSRGPTPSVLPVEFDEEPEQTSGATPSDDAIGLDILEIRPEDIRAEGNLSSLRPAPPPFLFQPSSPPQTPGPLPPEVIEVAVEFGGAPEAPPTPPVSLPPIRLEDESRLPRPVRAPAARPTDLVLPRTVVAAWSLLVLLAVTFAFIAGLLAGHYVWRAH